MFQAREKLLLGKRALHRSRVESALDRLQSVLHPRPEASDLTLYRRGGRKMSLSKPDPQSFHLTGKMHDLICES